MRLTSETSSMGEEGEAVKLGLQIVKLSLLDEAKSGFSTNFAGSPLSLTIFLNLLASGAKEKVLDQFLNCFGSKTKDELYLKSSNLLSLIKGEGEGEGDHHSSNKDDGGPTLLFASGMWVDDRFSLKPAFQDVINHIYKTEVRFRDFQNKCNEVTLEVNSWIKEKTKGLIKEMMNAVDANRLVVVVNALYFKGAWQRQFNVELTKHDKFYLLNGHDHVQVPFMCEYYEQHFYNSFDTFKLIKLPYRFGEGDKRRFYMYIFLPHEKDGLRNLIDHFDSNPDFLNRKFELYEQCVNYLKIPKFKFVWGFRTSDYMDDVGFGVHRLSNLGMLETNGSSEDRFVGAYHRCFIEVNEEGTEAAAVDEDEDCGCCLEDCYVPKPVINFIADHPFMFMVREDSSNVPFFFGAVVNPLEE